LIFFNDLGKIFGDFCMGRWPWSTRRTVEECLSIDVFWLKQYGYFDGYKRGGIDWKNYYGEVFSSIEIHARINSNEMGESYIRLIYTNTNNYTGEKIHLDYNVDLISTPCSFGGNRFWFLCPLSRDGNKCNRRVGKLYLPPGAKYFGCRDCYNLTYRSCKESHKYDRIFESISMKCPEMTAQMIKKLLS
jgi:hypothetical protein